MTALSPQQQGMLTAIARNDEPLRVQYEQQEGATMDALHRLGLVRMQRSTRRSATWHLTAAGHVAATLIEDLHTAQRRAALAESMANGGTVTLRDGTTVTIHSLPPKETRL